MRLIGLILILSLNACAGTKKASNVFEPEATDRLILQRTGCYGTCPIYEVVIFGNGIMTYNGKQYADRTGKFISQLDSEITFAVFKKAAKLSWGEYPNEFPIDNVDFPQFFIGMQTEKIDRMIKANSQADPELIQLGLEIDKLCDGISWQEQ